MFIQFVVVVCLPMLATGNFNYLSSSVSTDFGPPRPVHRLKAVLTGDTEDKLN